MEQNNFNHYNSSFYANDYDMNAFLGKTYRWMFLGLLMTFGVAIAGYLTGAVMYLFRYSGLLIALTIGELALVVIFSARLNTMSASAALRIFLAYAVLTGVVFSAYFLMFEMSSMVFAFAAAAIYFGVMAAYGKRTEKDLTSWGPMLRAGLVAMIVCALLSILFGGMSGLAGIVYCGIGLVIFMALTAYDVQKIQYLYYNIQPGTEMSEKAAVYGALQLYLDFINIFLLILRMMGRRRD